jgi:hypothetical protein
LVTVIRHALPWFKTDAAAQVDFNDPRTQVAVEALLSAMDAADPTEQAAVRALAKRRICEWIEFAEAHKPLLYENRGAGAAFATLLYDYGKPAQLGCWPAMGSVRNVDVEARVVIE